MTVGTTARVGAGIPQIAGASGDDGVTQAIGERLVTGSASKMGSRLLRAVGRGSLLAGEAKAVRGRIRDARYIADVPPADLVLETVPEDSELEKSVLGR